MTEHWELVVPQIWEETPATVLLPVQAPLSEVPSERRCACNRHQVCQGWACEYGEAA